MPEGKVGRLVTATAAASTTAVLLLFALFMVVTTATSAAVMTAEELLNLFRCRFVDLTYRSDKVKIFASKRVIEVEDDDVFLDFDDATTDDLPVWGVHRQGSTFDDELIELPRSIEEDLTRECLYGFSLRLSIGIFALEDKVKLIANLQAKELLLEGGEHHAHALDILEGTVGGGFLHEGTFVLIADV